MGKLSRTDAINGALLILLRPFMEYSNLTLNKRHPSKVVYADIV